VHNGERVPKIMEEDGIQKRKKFKTKKTTNKKSNGEQQQA
jgi:hypothetical protein